MSTDAPWNAARGRRRGPRQGDDEPQDPRRAPVSVDAVPHYYGMSGPDAVSLKQHLLNRQEASPEPAQTPTFAQATAGTRTNNSNANELMCIALDTYLKPIMRLITTASWDRHDNVCINTCDVLSDETLDAIRHNGVSIDAVSSDAISALVATRPSTTTTPTPLVYSFYIDHTNTNTMTAPRHHMQAAHDAISRVHAATGVALHLIHVCYTLCSATPRTYVYVCTNAMGAEDKAAARTKLDKKLNPRHNGNGIHFMFTAAATARHSEYTAKVYTRTRGGHSFAPEMVDKVIPLEVPTPESISVVADLTFHHAKKMYFMRFSFKNTSPVTPTAPPPPPHSPPPTATPAPASDAQAPPPQPSNPVPAAAQAAGPAISTDHAPMPESVHTHDVDMITQPQITKRGRSDDDALDPETGPTSKRIAAARQGDVAAVGRPDDDASDHETGPTSKRIAAARQGDGEAPTDTNNHHNATQ